MKTPMSMLKYLDAITYPIEKSDTLTEEEKAGKLPLGILVRDDSRPEYSDLYYNKLVKVAQNSVKGGTSI
jgi:2-oxoglutarate ferredoxin oxidoreductase subunit beta